MSTSKKTPKCGKCSKTGHNSRTCKQDEKTSEWQPLADEELHQRLLKENRRTMFAMVELINDMAEEAGVDLCLEINMVGKNLELIDVFLHPHFSKEGSQSVHIMHGAIMQARKTAEEKAKSEAEEVSDA